MKMETLPQLLKDSIIWHAENQPKATACVHLSNNGSKLESINYHELCNKALSLAAILINRGFSQQRVILLYKTGLDFVITFLACAFSGTISIPLNPLNKNNVQRSTLLLKKVIEETGAKAILSTDEFRNLETVTSLSIIKYLEDRNVAIITNEIIQKAIAQNSITKSKNSILGLEDLVYASSLSHLQYTSGSLSNPKAVMSTHQNLAYSLYETAKAWNYTPKSIIVNWAPLTHVYGLVVGLLVPLYTGSQTILIDPNDFLTDPSVWLKTISTFQATHSGCPNFGYEFTDNHFESANQVTLNDLNLSSWQVAINGGERVQWHTQIKFYNKFKHIGFRLESFYPAYGMSECLGLIATPKKGQKPTPSFFDKQSLQLNRVVISDFGRNIVSCGSPLDGITLKIKDPKTGEELPAETIGEVWINGPMCSPGYWDVSTIDLSKSKKIGNLSRKIESASVQTGDIGFILNNELFLVGRIKETIKIFGKNYNPIDIEMDLKDAHPMLSQSNKNKCLTLSSIVGDGEELFILQEIGENLLQEQYKKIVTAIRKTLSQSQGLDAYAVILVFPQSLPRTGSGKLQRTLAREQLLNQKLQIVYESVKNIQPEILKA